MQEAKAFKPRKLQSTYEWLSENYQLPDVVGNLAGRYDFYYTPYFIGVANALDDKAVVEVIMMKAAQIGWTYFLIGYLAKRIEANPAPMLAVFAKEKDGKSFHDEKLLPAFRATSILEGLIDVNTTRKNGVRWDLRSFPGGFLKLVGSNSPGNVKSTSSVGVAIIEEPDDTSDDVKGQGNAISLAEERLKRYVNAKLLVGGTPTIKDLSKTEHRFKQSDQRVLPVACNECGEKHVLDWANVSWLEADKSAQPHEIYGHALPGTAVYTCPNCGCVWDDDQRKKNIRDTVFAALAEGDPMAGWKATQPFQGKAGFGGLSELYACIPGTSLEDVVKDKLNADHLAAQGDLSELITFTNQKLGRTFEYESTAPDEEALRERAEDYPEMTVPTGGLILTAGVDVQDDRLAVIIRAWGRGMESWLVWWGELYAKTSTTDTSDVVWRDLAELLERTFQSESGYRLPISARSIDSGGHATEQVYSFVRPRLKRGYMAIKGSSSDYGKREIYSAPKRIDYKSRTKASKFGLGIYQVGTHKAKDLIFGEGGRIGLAGAGAGRMHWFKDVRQDYYQQINGIIKAPSARHRGRLIWQDKPGQSIEAADCEVYALHAAYSLRLHRWRDDKWDAYEAKIKQKDLFKQQVTSTETKQPTPRSTSRKSFWD